MKIRLGALLAVIAFCAPVATQADESLDPRDGIARPDELAEVQGKWVRTTKTDGGTFKVVKVHTGNKTTVTVCDSEGNVVGAKESEFRLEHTGKVRVLTFFNNTITVGPQKGQSDNEPRSYIYRVVGDTFVEVQGMLVGDDDQPLAFTWQRLRE